MTKRLRFLPRVVRRGGVFSVQPSQGSEDIRRLIADR
jgi:hypothetical protein